MKLTAALLGLCSILAGCDEEPGADEGPAETTGDDGSSEGGLGDEIDCEAQPVITYDTFGRGFLATYCNGCHGAEVEDRQGAPETVIFDAPEQVDMFVARILARTVPADGVGPMPPAGGIVPTTSTVCGSG